uniref:Uncharacterized protein n=1 Tax=Psilocybe cubensis TaxID=181762 RepID=A0A8H8CKX2_PSICU
MNNSKAASLAARLVENNHPGRLRHRDEEDDDDEALFAELEEEIENDTNASVREHGLQVLKAEMERMKHKKANHYGEYTEITDEKEVVQKLAPKYTNTRFFRVFVENIPWLVEKLFIKVLPCVICFVDGIAKDRLVGFEELGNDDMFSTAVLELRLAQSNAIQKSSGNALEPLFKVSSSRRQEQKDDDDEFDM